MSSVTSEPTLSGSGGCEPSVSVVIPSARGGTYLREAVASVQSQTVTDWELIIVADGCEDDLSDIGSDDPRIRLIRQARRGESVARNVGVRSARGPMIAFLDDDDRMLPDRLRQQLEAMKDLNVGLCHTWWRVIDGGGVAIRDAVSLDARSEEGPQYRDLLRDLGVPPITSSMVRKSLFEEVGGFDSTMRLVPDFDLIFRIARESRLRVVPEVLTEYRRHGDNTRPTMASSDGLLASILIRHLCRAEDAGNNADIRAARIGLSKAKRAHARSAMLRARQAAGVHKYATAVRLAEQAFRLSPSRACVTLVRSTVDVAALRRMLPRERK